MKRLVFFIWLISACIVTLPINGLASYLIKLKNGSEYVTSAYWEEGNQIKFYFSGGQIGFSKDSVVEIIDSDLPVQEEIITPEAPPMPEAQPASEAPANKQVSGDIDHELYKAKKQAILLKYKTVREKLNQALESNDREAELAAGKEIKEINEEFTALSREVLQKNNGAFPDWWHTLTE